MHLSEDELREALKRKDPGERFTKEVMVRVARQKAEGAGTPGLAEQQEGYRDDRAPREPGERPGEPGKLEEDAARPILSWRLDYFTYWPHVRGFVPHNNVYNNGRMQDVWIDK